MANISVSLPPALIDKLEQLSKTLRYLGYTREKILEDAIRNHLEELEQDYQDIKMIAEMKSGIMKTIPAQDVYAKAGL